MTRRSALTVITVILLCGCRAERSGEPASAELPSLTAGMAAGSPTAQVGPSRTSGLPPVQRTTPAAGGRSTVPRATPSEVGHPKPPMPGEQAIPFTLSDLAGTPL